MKPKYVSIKNMLKIPWHFGILLGQRSNGKSYAVKEHCLWEAFNDPDKHKFVYLRRWQIDVKGSDVEGYFRDAPVSAITSNKYSCITVYRGGIYFSNIGEDGKIERGVQCGFVMYLSGETHYKSQSYLDVSSIIYEEFISNGGYLWREPEKLESLVSTIARDREIRVWMIGNTISRLCPFFSEWSLDRIPTQKQSTIDVYEKDTGLTNSDGSPRTVRIAVYFCEQSVTGKMFFGASAGMINKGTWQVREYPHLPCHYKDCKKLYSILYEYKDFCFKMELVEYNNDRMVFLHPHKKEPDYAGRIISDTPAASKLVTDHLIPVLKGDILLIDAYNKGKIFYSDNLTGSDFEAILKSKGAA